MSLILTPEQTKLMAWLFSALYLSEVWYGPWRDPHHRGHGIPAYRARGIVMFDRIINGEIDRAEAKA